MKARDASGAGLFLLKWALLGSWVGCLAGVASALFLWALDRATQIRLDSPWLLFLLPVGGIGIGALYAHHGKTVDAGTNLLLDTIHDGGDPIPFRMVPMILGTTVLTHLLGGSAGREGTAVQMGGTLADLAGAPLKLSPAERQILLMTGIAGGFGAVFGTPLAGAVFGIEVLTIGRLRANGLLGCLVASVVGDLVCRGLGIQHHHYTAADTFSATPALIGFVLLAGACFAGASAGFIELTHIIQGIGKSWRWAHYVRPFLGGLLVVAATIAVGNQDFNGLGLGLIERSFEASVPDYAFVLKILFTAVTIGFGFKGGEVTPLFCIGATLGCAFAGVTGQDPALFAALGFVAVFAGAANTPLACTIMGVELFGVQLAIPLSLVCILSFILSGRRGIYQSQRVRGPDGSDSKSLREIRVDSSRRA